MKQNTQKITTGIDKLDSLFIELKPNSIILLGGKPENDVTNFSLNLLANLCISGKKCLFCSFGLWRQELLRRLIVRKLHNDFMEVEKSHFKNYLSFIAKALENISQWNLETFELLGDEHSLELKIKEFKPDYIFIDCYEDLEQLISFDNDVVNFVKEIAEKYNASIFINTLLRRNISERTPKCITIFDINVPKEIIKMADDIILAYYYDYAEFRCRYVEKEKKVIDIISVKLNKTITLNYDTNTGKMW